MGSSRSTILIKLGGASLQSTEIFDIVAKAIVKYKKLNDRLVLVHGGGPAINAELKLRGIEWNFLRGQRVTTPEMMAVIEMVLSGKVNRDLVRCLSKQGLSVFGCSGVDFKTFLCTQASPDLGQVGLIESVHSSWLQDLLDRADSPIPVVAPIGIGYQGESYNINADWAASRMAVAMQVDQLIYLTDQKGILNRNGESFLKLSKNQLEKMIEDEIGTGGMLTKVVSILHALENGITNVRIMNAKDIEEGMTSDRVGTWCVANESNSMTSTKILEAQHVSN